MWQVKDYQNHPKCVCTRKKNNENHAKCLYSRKKTLKVMLNVYVVSKKL